MCIVVHLDEYSGESGEEAKNGLKPTQFCEQERLLCPNFEMSSLAIYLINAPWWPDQQKNSFLSVKFTIDKSLSFKKRLKDKIVDEACYFW
jgi:hypothetical protein